MPIGDSAAPRHGISLTAGLDGAVKSDAFVSKEQFDPFGIELDIESFADESMRHRIIRFIDFHVTVIVDFALSDFEVLKQRVG